jgi:hypothetical protein
MEAGAMTDWSERILSRCRPRRMGPGSGATDGQEADYSCASGGPASVHRVTGRGAADGLTNYEGYSIGGGRERARRPVRRTPLFEAQHSERYGRQELIADYQRAFDANLIVVIDQIVADAVTYLEELLYDLDTDRPLHVLLASPGGDGEVALRMVRAMHLRCTELIVIVPDQAKSAATLLCLGADRILMGPAGDLGPVDPQLPATPSGAW